MKSSEILLRLNSTMDNPQKDFTIRVWCKLLQSLLIMKDFSYFCSFPDPVKLLNKEMNEFQNIAKEKKFDIQR